MMAILHRFNSEFDGCEGGIGETVVSASRMDEWMGLFNHTMVREGNARTYSRMKYIYKVQNG